MANKKVVVLTGTERKAQLLEIGAQLASKFGAQNVQRKMVADAAGCAMSLVSSYMGDTATAQRAYANKARRMGFKMPTKAEADEIGIELRQHKPRDKRDTRKRSAKEVEAIKRKAGAAKKLAKVPTPRTAGKPTAGRTEKAGAAKKSPVKKSASVSIGPAESAGKPAAVPEKKIAHKKTAKPIGAVSNVATDVSGNVTGFLTVSEVNRLANMPPETKPAVRRVRKPVQPKEAPAQQPPLPGAPLQAPERKSAARAPKLPPPTA